MCIRNGDEVFEVPDGLAATLHNADHSTADLICGRMKDFWLRGTQTSGYRLLSLLLRRMVSRLVLYWKVLDCEFLKPREPIRSTNSHQMNIAAATLFDDITSLSRVGRFQDALSKLESDRPMLRAHNEELFLTLSAELRF